MFLFGPSPRTIPDYAPRQVIVTRSFVITFSQAGARIDLRAGAPDCLNIAPHSLSWSQIPSLLAALWVLASGSPQSVLDRLVGLPRRLGLSQCVIDALHDEMEHLDEDMVDYLWDAASEFCPSQHRDELDRAGSPMQSVFSAYLESIWWLRG